VSHFWWPRYAIAFIRHTSTPTHAIAFFGLGLDKLVFGERDI